jgi:hypothetical protein
MKKKQRGMIIGSNDLPHQYYVVARRRPCYMLQGSQCSKTHCNYQVFAIHTLFARVLEMSQNNPVKQTCCSQLYNFEFCLYTLDP